MTKDEILNMPAGREIDDLVAEKVMGWHKGNYVYSDGKTFGEKDSDWLDTDGNFICGIATDDGYEDDEDFHLLHWHPSESILWVWKVVEKMNAHYGADVEFISHYPGKDCIAHFWNCDPNMPIEQLLDDYTARADTMPLAICRAALLAVMEDTNGK